MIVDVDFGDDWIARMTWACWSGLTVLVLVVGALSDRWKVDRDPCELPQARIHRG